jgi:hypothetical protein
MISLDLRISLFPLLPPPLNLKRALVAGLAGPTPRIAHLSLMDADAGIGQGDAVARNTRAQRDMSARQLSTSC